MTRDMDSWKPISIAEGVIAFGEHIPSVKEPK
jgi:hypothetical protein